MAENYRDPKVTSTEDAASGGGTGKMIMWAVIALVVLLLLAWLLGLFGGADEPETVLVPDETAAETGTVVVEDGADGVGANEVVVDEVDEGEVVVTE